MLPRFVNAQRPTLSRKLTSPAVRRLAGSAPADAITAGNRPASPRRCGGVCRTSSPVRGTRDVNAGKPVLPGAASYRA